MASIGKRAYREMQLAYGSKIHDGVRRESRTVPRSLEAGSR